MSKRKEPTQAASPHVPDVPPANDEVITFSVRVRESVKTRLKLRAAGRGTNLQTEVENALNLYLSETTAQTQAALSPFPDARPEEIELLATFLTLLRSGPADVRTILKTTARLFTQSILKKTA
jgi:hypothetical protein